MAEPVAVAIEGPCCAGKTTLGEGLLRHDASGGLAIIPDYADFVGGGDCMPDPDPPTLRAELDALEALLQIEARRLAAHVPKNPAPGLVLIDRSVLTLSWHCSGIDRKNGSTDPYQPAIEANLRADPRPRWPDFVIYLDVSHAVQLSRNHGKFEPDSIFMDAAYNQGFREGYEGFAATGSVPAVRIDADQEPKKVLSEALSFLGAQGLH